MSNVLSPPTPATPSSSTTTFVAVRRDHVRYLNLRPDEASDDNYTSDDNLTEELFWPRSSSGLTTPTNPIIGDEELSLLEEAEADDDDDDGPTPNAPPLNLFVDRWPPGISAERVNPS